MHLKVGTLKMVYHNVYKMVFVLLLIFYYILVNIFIKRNNKHVIEERNYKLQMLNLLLFSFRCRCVKINFQL